MKIWGDEAIVLFKAVLQQLQYDILFLMFHVIRRKVNVRIRMFY